jgi:hypothetical protein
MPSLAGRWMKTSPSVGCSKPAIMRRVVVLPQPLGPMQRKELAVAHLEGEVIDGDRVAKAFGDVMEFHAERICHSHLPVPMSPL